MSAQQAGSGVEPRAARRSDAQVRPRPAASLSQGSAPLSLGAKAVLAAMKDICRPAELGGDNKAVLAEGLLEALSSQRQHSGLRATVGGTFTQHLSELLLRDKIAIRQGPASRSEDTYYLRWCAHPVCTPRTYTPALRTYTSC